METSWLCLHLQFNRCTSIPVRIDKEVSFNGPEAGKGEEISKEN